MANTNTTRSTSNSPHRYPDSLLGELRSRFAAWITPNRGDEKSEYYPYVRIEKISNSNSNNDEFLVEGFSNPSNAGTDSGDTAFSERVDYIEMNGVLVEIDEEISFPDGLAFDYYWGLDAASINAMV